MTFETLIPTVVWARYSWQSVQWDAPGDLPREQPGSRASDWQGFPVAGEQCRLAFSRSQGNSCGPRILDHVPWGAINAAGNVVDGRS